MDTYHQSIGNCVDNMVNELQQARDRLLLICDKVILSHVLGFDFDRFNKFTTSYSSGQEILDASTRYINQAVISINGDYSLTTPLLQDSLHSIFLGSYVRKYHKLYNGYHPFVKTVLTWGEEIHKSVLKNLPK